ncbi:MAG: M15 family metallopeptidase [Saprospiraceae bacterium]|nr:M15 family metallopeptidase [Saprospiraceae bacterium]
MKFTAHVGAWALLLLLAACGPEAETGAVFGKYHAPAARKVGQSLNDTIVPPDLQDNKSVEIASNSGAPASQMFAETLHYLLGQFEPARHADFATLGKPYTDKPDMYLRREALAAFKKMYAAAKKEGIVLKIVSATRTFAQQKNIWEGKWSRFAAETPDPQARAQRILEYSAMPGASRHHWGTDIDLNDLNNASFEAGGRFEKVYSWLRTHAHEYGFCQPYSARSAERPNGYNEEKWHWSYLPVATPLLRQYSQSVQDGMLSGFQGAPTARNLSILKHYVLGISPACQ